MCQLALINTNNLLLNRVLTTCALIQNSTDNKDGWGIYQENGLAYRSKNCAAESVNIGSRLNTCITNTNPVILHTRKASTNNGAKTICEKNSHPFDSKDFILMHNGYLIPKSDEHKKELEKLNIIDSEYFLRKLQERYEKDADFIASVRETMALFDGKFAFLIYCKSAYLSIISIPHFPFV